MMVAWASLGADAVLSVMPLPGFSERMGKALRVEWGVADSPSMLAICMRSTAEAFRSNDVSPNINSLFFGAISSNQFNDEEKLRREFSSMTLDGCLVSDGELGAPDDFMASSLFVWLSSSCGNDVEMARFCLNSFSDLLLFLADCLDVEDARTAESLLRRLA